MDENKRNISGYIIREVNIACPYATPEQKLAIGQKVLAKLGIAKNDMPTIGLVDNPMVENVPPAWWSISQKPRGKYKNTGLRYDPEGQRGRFEKAGFYRKSVNPYDRPKGLVQKIYSSLKEKGITWNEAQQIARYVSKYGKIEATKRVLGEEIFTNLRKLQFGDLSPKESDETISKMRKAIKYKKEQDQEFNVKSIYTRELPKTYIQDKKGDIRYQRPRTLEKKDSLDITPEDSNREERIVKIADVVHDPEAEYNSEYKKYKEDIIPDSDKFFEEFMKRFNQEDTNEEAPEIIIPKEMELPVTSTKKKEVSPKIATKKPIQKHKEKPKKEVVTISRTTIEPERQETATTPKSRFDKTGGKKATATTPTVVTPTSVTIFPKGQEEKEITFQIRPKTTRKKYSVSIDEYKKKIASFFTESTIKKIADGVWEYYVIIEIAKKLKSQRDTAEEIAKLDKLIERLTEYAKEEDYDSSTDQGKRKIAEFWNQSLGQLMVTYANKLEKLSKIEKDSNKETTIPEFKREYQIYRGSRSALIYDIIDQDQTLIKVLKRLLFELDMAILQRAKGLFLSTTTGESGFQISWKNIRNSPEEILEFATELTTKMRDKQLLVEKEERMKQAIIETVSPAVKLSEKTIEIPTTLASDISRETDANVAKGLETQAKEKKEVFELLVKLENLLVKKKESIAQDDHDKTLVYIEDIDKAIKELDKHHIKFDKLITIEQLRKKAISIQTKVKEK